MYWIAAIVVILIIALWYYNKENYWIRTNDPWPSDWSLYGYRIAAPWEFPAAKTRIHRGRVAGGIVVSQIIPDMSEVYPIGDGTYESCDLCVNCNLCPMCSRCMDTMKMIANKN